MPVHGMAPVLGMALDRAGACARDGACSGRACARDGDCSGHALSGHVLQPLRDDVRYLDTMREFIAHVDKICILALMVVHRHGAPGPRGRVPPPPPSLIAWPRRNLVSWPRLRLSVDMLWCNTPSWRSGRRCGGWPARRRHARVTRGPDATTQGGAAAAAAAAAERWLVSCAGRRPAGGV